MPASEEQQISFGEFVLDLARGTLQRSGEDVGLRPQAFEVLSYLATHSGKLVSRGEILESVWGNAAVTDDSLTQCIVEIRKAINDEAHSIVRTVPRRGFIFDPPDTASAGSSSDHHGSDGDTQSLRRMASMVAAFVAVIAMIAFLAIRSDVNESPDTVVDISRPDMSPYSIAVLPFADMSEAGDQQYFGDGIAEEILAKLTEYQDLVVIARTSSFRFRDRQDDVIAIGQSLNAAYVLEGSIRKSGERLRITAQLIETRGGTHEWSQSFDRELTVENLLDIQSEVAAAVAESVGTSASRFVSEDSDSNTTNTKAYDLYLEGMFFLQQIRTSAREVDETDVFAAATERFEAAIREDPEWATPHAALGRLLHFRASPYQGHRDAESYEWLRKSKASLLEAIRIDPNYAPAYSSLGHVLLHLDFDFAGAEAAYDRARALGSYFHWGYALFLAKAGRFDEAIAEYKTTLAHDPLTVGARAQLAGTYRCAGDYAESIDEFEKSLRMAPGRDDLYIPIAYIHGKTGNAEEGLALIELYLNPEIPALRYAPAYAALGQRDKAYTLLEEADPSDRWWFEYAVGTALSLGEKELALTYIEQAVEKDPRRLINLLCLFGIDSLQGDPRFEQLLRKAGFPVVKSESESDR